MPKAPVVIVKFRKGADQGKRCAELSHMLGSDLLEAKPVFPEDEDEEMSSLFEVVLNDAASPQRIVATLREGESIEYAHQPAERRPKSSG